MEVGGGCSSVTPVWAVLGLRPRPPAGAHKVSVPSSTADNSRATTSQQNHSTTALPSTSPACASLRRAAVIRLTHAAARRPEIRVLLFCGSGDCDKQHSDIVTRSRALVPPVPSCPSARQYLLPSQEEHGTLVSGGTWTKLRHGGSKSCGCRTIYNVCVR